MQVGTPIERKRDRSEDNVQTAEQQRRASPARCRGLSRVGVVAKLSRVRDVAGCRESFLDFASCREQAEPRGRRGRREGPGVARNRAQRQTGCVTRRALLAAASLAARRDCGCRISSFASAAERRLCVSFRCSAEGRYLTVTAYERIAL